jgi:hypothetical protein
MVSIGHHDMSIKKRKDQKESNTWSSSFSFDAPNPPENPGNDPPSWQNII